MGIAVIAGTAHGWAVVRKGFIDVRTVADTRRAAIVNWLVTEAGTMITNMHSDEDIEAIWHAKIDDKTICTVVSIKAIGGGA